MECDRTNIGLPPDYDPHHALTSSGRQVIFSLFFLNILAEVFHSFHQDGKDSGEDILEGHRAQNHVPRAPTLNELQDFIKNEFNENQCKSDSDNSNKETDLENDALTFHASCNSKGRIIIKPTTLQYYSSIQGWLTVLISAKRWFAFYVTTANTFPIHTIDLESAKKILASAITAFEEKGRIIDNGLDSIIALLFLSLFYFSISL